jgi:hypothetical protein
MKILVLIPVLCLLATSAQATPQGNVTQYITTGANLQPFQNTPPEGWTPAPPEQVPADPIRQRPSGRLAIAVRPWEETWDPFVPPAEAERVEELTMVAARGEYEPASFLLHAFEDLANVEATAEIEGGLGVEVRRVVPLWAVADAEAKTCRPVDAALATGPTTIPAQRTQRYFVDVWVPFDQKPGVYRGHVRLRQSTTSGQSTASGQGPASGQSAASGLTALGRALPLTVRVLDLTLPEPPVEYAFWYGTDGPWGEFAARVPQEMGLLRECGLNSIVTCNSIRPLLQVEEGPVQVNLERYDAVIDAFMAAGLTGRVAIDARWISGWCSQFAEAVDKAGGDSAKVTGVEGTYEYPPYDSPRTKETFQQIIQALLDRAQERHWPPLTFYAQEEAWSETRLAQERYFVPLLREMGASTLMVNNKASGQGDETLSLGDLFDLRCYDAFDEDVIRRAREAGRVLAMYNNGGPRRDVGFYAVKVGAQHFSRWAFNWGTPFRGEQPWAFQSWLANGALPTPEGPLPTPLLIALREGIDDTRTLRLLEEAGPAGQQRVAALTERFPLYPSYRAYVAVNAPPEAEALRAHVMRSLLALRRGARLPSARGLTLQVSPPTYQPAEGSAGASSSLRNGNFEEGEEGGLPAGWATLQAQDHPGRVKLTGDAAAEGRLGLRFDLPAEGRRDASVLQALGNAERLQGQRLRLQARFRVLSGQGGLMVRVRQWHGDDFLGDAARIDASVSPAGLNVGTRSEGYLCASTPGLTPYEARWFSSQVEAPVSTRTTGLDVCLEMGRSEGKPFVAEVDDLELQLLEPPPFAVQPLRALFVATERALPVRVLVGKNYREKATRLEWVFQPGGPRGWVEVPEPVRASGLALLHLPLAGLRPGRHKAEIRLWARDEVLSAQTFDFHIEPAP